MKKVIVAFLIISVLCLNGCKKLSSDTSSDILSNISSIEYVDNLNDSSDASIISSINSTTNSTTSSVVSDNSSDTQNTIIRPEKVKTIYGFKEGISDHIKNTFYDTKNGNTLQYCLFIPDDYSANKKYPVILFLHGAGEIGTDNASQLTNIKNMFSKNPDYVSQAIVICPQTPEWWRLDRDYGDRKGTLSSAMNLLEEIQKQYSCDENRIYLTGLSMGGYATWELLQNYSHIFAAGVPVCGFGNEMNAAALVDIPIRIYHGTADPTVSFSSSQSMYDAIVAAGGKKVELFPLEGVGHDAWSYAYADTTMFEWMFSQDKSKSTPSPIKPVGPFRIVDSNGNNVITIDDVIDVDYSIVNLENRVM
ncbi:MAG: prolyl oligopeptidase family serine peptidase [Clostridia bacterium]|nr:prolyl oligopeptidase family serine peptidase [Clostridia bacterium]